MEISGPILWAAWAAFGVAVLLVTARFVHAAITTPVAAPPVEVLPEEPWLYCEEGAPVDVEARWFRVRPGGRTVLGSLPRSATADTTYVYLNAHDVAQDNAVITCSPETGRYLLEAPPGVRVRHNNEELAPGREAPLTDGDTVEVGRLCRFRFTLTGPPLA